MRPLILLSMLAVPGAALAAPANTSADAAKAPPTAQCVNVVPRWTGPASGKAEVRNLGELPAGTLVLAVVRDVGGCIEPVVVRYGYGSPAEGLPRRR